MSRTRPTAAVGAMISPVIGLKIGAAMIGVLALAGCGSGQIAQTSEQVAAVGGVNGGSGSVLVRDAQIEFGEKIEGANVYARGADAPLKMSIVNTGPDGDRLTSATSSAAESVTVTGDAEVPGGQVLAVEGEPAAAPTTAAPGATEADTPGAAEVGGAAPGEGEAPATTSAATPSATPGETRVAGEANIVLTGLREDVRAGLTYPLVLTFERAGEIRLDVPVGNPAEPREVEKEG